MYMCHLSHIYVGEKVRVNVNRCVICLHVGQRVMLKFLCLHTHIHGNEHAYLHAYGYVTCISVCYVSACLQMYKLHIDYI